MGYSNFLTITGLPCSGKTTVGSLLATKLNYTFIDLDDYIVKKFKSSIQNIFETLGEAAFRDYEHDSLNSIILNNKNKKLVLSLGGGTVCFNNNLSLCLNNTTLIWLNTNINIIVTRLLGKESLTRPLFNNVDVTEKVHRLKNNRISFYESSHIQINIENENPSIIIDKIISNIRLL